MDIKDAWGYGAIVFPRRCEWQGFVILDPDQDRVREAVSRAIASAQEVHAQDPRRVPEGTLASALAACMKDGPEYGVGVFASALSQITGWRFWCVDVIERDDGHETSCSRLNAQTPEQAREEINTRVMPLRMGQALKELEKKKH